MNEGFFFFRKSPNPNQSDSGEDRKMSMDVVFLSTFSCSHLSGENIGAPGMPSFRAGLEKTQGSQAFAGGQGASLWVRLKPLFFRGPLLAVLVAHSSSVSGLTLHRCSSLPSDGAFHKTRICSSAGVPRQEHRACCYLLGAGPGAQWSLPIPALSAASKLGGRS